MFDFPLSTIVNRVIPKARIIENARPSARLKNLLTCQIQQIRWHAKLSPETIKIPATSQIPEIQIFRIILKSSEIHPDLLELLDKAIPQPMFIIIETVDAKLAYSAAHKRPSAADTSQWIVGARFTTSFADQPVSFSPLPVALDLSLLYTAFFHELLPLSARPSEALEPLIERCQHYLLLQKKSAQLTSKVNKEKQFNRRVALNQELNEMKSKINSMQ